MVLLVAWALNSNDKPAEILPIRLLSCIEALLGNVSCRLCFPDVLPFHRAREDCGQELTNHVLCFTIHWQYCIDIDVKLTDLSWSSFLQAAVPHYFHDKHQQLPDLHCKTLKGALAQRRAFHTNAMHSVCASDYPKHLSQKASFLKSNWGLWSDLLLPSLVFQEQQNCNRLWNLHTISVPQLSLWRGIAMLLQYWTV